MMNQGPMNIKLDMMPRQGTKNLKGDALIKGGTVKLSEEKILHCINAYSDMWSALLCL